MEAGIPKPCCVTESSENIRNGKPCSELIILIRCSSVQSSNARQCSRLTQVRLTRSMAMRRLYLAFMFCMISGSVWGDAGSDLERANEEYAAGNYEVAIDYFTQAIRIR